MRHNSISILAAACALAFALPVSAQDYPPQGGFPQGDFQNGQRPEGKGPKGERPAKMPSVEEQATMQTDQMKAEIALDDKQYKKVYKLFIKEIDAERDFMGGFRPQRPDMQGGPGGHGGPGGGGFPGGGGPGMGGGMPGGGMGGPGGGFGGPEMSGGGEFNPGRGDDMESRYEQLESVYAKNDKQLQKILTPEQYSQWRQAHPVKRPPMPEMSF